MAASMSTLTHLSHVFRAYDIRGTAGTELSEEFAHSLGNAFVAYLRETQYRVESVALGMDNRPSSPALYAAVRDGLSSAGVTVRDIGVCSTPLLGFAVYYYRLDGGICVTGSHNSPRINGFKLERESAYPLAGDDIEHLRTLMTTGDLTSTRERRHAFPLDVRDAYLRALAELIRMERPLHVVIDAGNGVMGSLAPELFRRLGCEVTELYCEPDSSFPHHIPNPEAPENMRDLQRLVVSADADLGVAFDGDGDRLGVVDEEGSLFAPERTLILLARDLLQRHPGATVLLDVKSSRTAIEDIVNHGGKPELTRTGHSLIRRRMADEGVLLAGEHSGHFFTTEDFCGTSDALLAAARLASVLSRETAPLSKALGHLPERHSSGLVELRVPEHLKQRVAARIAEVLSKAYPGVITVDGVRVEFADGWALVRASNTRPRLTLRFEADTAERLAEIQSLILSHLTAIEMRMGLSVTPELPHD